MQHRSKIDLETRLLAARDDLLARADAVTARHAQNVAAAREHRVDPVAAGVALEAIAKTKSYRLGGYTTFDAFARAELGFTRFTAHRLRARAAPADADRSEAGAAVAAVERWLRKLGVRRAAVTAHRRAPRLTIVVDVADVQRLTTTERKRSR